MHIALPLTVVLALVPSALHAQDGFFSKWEARVRATSAKQPTFPIPVIAPSSQLVQLARFDVQRQITPTHFTTIFVDSGRGVNLIPFANTEVDINLPPLLLHHNVNVIDGAGDFSAVLKYRPFASPSGKHDYSFGGQVLFTVPTGSYKNGTLVSTSQPTLLGAKGFGRFDVQSALGGILPNSSVMTVGRTIAWNTTAQYRIGKIFYPEIEANSSYFFQGPNDGKNQNFISPGLMISKLKLRKDPQNRLALFLGGSFQVATSTFHAYNHALVFTSRLSF